MRIAVACDSITEREYFRRQIHALGHLCSATDCVAVQDLTTCIQGERCQLALVVLGDEQEASLTSLKEIQRAIPVPLLATGLSQNAEWIARVQETGVREYIANEGFLEGFSLALGNLQRAGTLELFSGHVLAILSANPGTGVTTLASAIAFELAKRDPEKVVLAEVGSSPPELAMNLGFEPQVGVEELLRDWDRVDATMLQRILVNHNLGVRLLLHRAETPEASPIPDGAPKRLLTLLRNLYAYTVVDGGHGMPPSALQTAQVADTVVVVVRLDVPSVRLGRGFLKRLVKTHGISPDRIHLVLNRTNQRYQMPRTEAERILELPVRVAIPEDPSSVNYAVSEGQPLSEAAPRGAITKAIRGYVNSLEIKFVKK